jgi:hypothetical protein
MRRLLAHPHNTPLVAVLIGMSTMALLAVGLLEAGEAVAEAEGEVRASEVVRGPAGRLPARPAEIDDVPDATDGLLRIEPPVVRIAAEPGEAGQPTIAIINGGDGEASLLLEVLAVAADDQGAPVPVAPDDPLPPGEALPSAANWLTLAEDAVHVGPQERALLRPSIDIPSGTRTGPYLAALRGRIDGSREPTREIVTFIVVDVIDPDAELEPAPIELEATLSRRDGRAALDLHLDSSDLAHVGGTATVRRSLVGPGVEVELPEVLLLPDVPRVRTVTFDMPRLPGRFRADVVVESSAGQRAEATASAWLWDPVVAALTAVALLVVAAGLLLVVSRHRRAHAPDSDAAETDVGSGSDDDGGDR